MTAFALNTVAFSDMDSPNMVNGIRTRKQTSQAAMPNTRHLNGHTSSQQSNKEAVEAKENIFLFYPNIIGTYCQLLAMVYE